MALDRQAASPRPLLSPSNFNRLSPTPAEQANLRPKPKISAAENSTGTSAHASSSMSAGWASPPSVDPNVARRSPRDRMNIDHLLSSSRSPWSPRHFRDSRPMLQPPRFTNSFQDANSVQRPTTGKGISLQPVRSLAPGFEAESLSDQHGSDSDGQADLPGSSSDLKVSAGECSPSGMIRYLPVQLFVAAVGDGEVNQDTPPKTREILDQVVKKVSKEQNTVVNVKGEGALHIQLRVFAASSVEAKALKDYIMSHNDQVPCPFIMLARQLPMAVAYDTAILDPTNANVADRLRKQAKTRAIKLLREVIWDDASGVTAAMLRGRHGPLLPAERLETLIMKRAAPLNGELGSTRYISFPAVRRQGDLAQGGDASLENSQAESHQGQDKTSICQAKIEGHNKSSFPSRRATESHFPVSLTVIAIGEGTIARNTQPKLLHRLKQLMSKVPKEHHCSIELPKYGSIPLRMRLFVANSEDAKAAREYVSANQSQRPTPFVILSHALPIAVSYDARTLDVSDANVVDCLRKQAKTRAVKLIKETITDPSVGVTIELLRGYEGALALADILNGPLMNHAVAFGGGKKYISFPARNRQAIEASSNERGEEFRGLESLATAAMFSTKGQEITSEGNASESSLEHHMMNQQRVCEMCKSMNDGSYGTGRFCSKACRYEAHALRVAQQRRNHSTSTQPIKTEKTAQDQSGSHSEGGNEHVENQMRMSIDAHPMKENTSISLDGSSSDQKAGDRSKLFQQDLRMQLFQMANLAGFTGDQMSVGSKRKR
uniref:Uncharacterized protein n=1 Tax=Hanusia phi TaxID=3032 RepID=A0A7S0I0P0_9CRYP